MGTSSERTIEMTTTDIEKADDQPGTDLEPMAGGDDRGRGPIGHTTLLEPSESPKSEAMRTRVLLPLLLPVVSAAALFFYVINLSRALIAGGEWGSLVIASLITLLILGGAVWISSQPSFRTGTLAIVVTVLLLLVAGMGLTTLGASEPHETEATGFVPPKGPPVATVTVDALATLKFQSDNFDTQAGINTIEYVLGGGVHTLVFVEKEFNGFELAVDAGTPTDSGKVELVSGTTYTIYCSIPGHRAAGMEATVTVS